MKTSRPPRGVFITGTDTEVGKTYVGTLLAKAWRKDAVRVAVYKPVASGSRQVGTQLVSDDADLLWTAAGRPLDLRSVCPQRFLAPLAPPVAARMTNQVVDEELLVSGLSVWAGFDVVIVEGAGGWMSPISENLLNADLAHALNYPVIVVVPNRLGMIHQALATVTAVTHYREGIRLAGMIINDLPHLMAPDPSTTSNAEQLARWMSVRILAHVHAGDAALVDASFLHELLR